MKLNIRTLKKLDALMGPDFPLVTTLFATNETLSYIFGPDYFSLLNKLNNKYFYYGLFVSAGIDGFIFDRQKIKTILKEEIKIRQEMIGKIFLVLTYIIGVVVIGSALVFLNSDIVHDWLGLFFGQNK
jgi:hypothetical protein